MKKCSFFHSCKNGLFSEVMDILNVACTYYRCLTKERNLAEGVGCLHMLSSSTPFELSTSVSTLERFLGKYTRRLTTQGAKQPPGNEILGKQMMQNSVCAQR